MTNDLDRETLVQLARHLGWPAVSIHLPTHRSSPGTQEDRIRLKNLLREAGARLATGMRPAEAESMLAPIASLVEDDSFWREGFDGLAAFVSRDTSLAFRTDFALAESVVVGTRFSIRPLLSAAAPDPRFFVLALSKNSVRLFEVERDGARETPLSGAPSSLADALRYDDFERELQFHSRTPASAAGRGRRVAIFHGHGGIPDVEKEEIARYLREVDRAVTERLRDEGVPLLLAGVEYLLAIYRSVNSYPALLEGELPGNPDLLTPFEVHAAAWPVAEPHFHEDFERDSRLFEELAGGASTSTDLREILPAAHDGRVKVLFIAPDRPVWGAFDPAAARVVLHDAPGPEDLDLADLAVAETLMHGGTVYGATGEEALSAAAVFRY